MKKFSFLTIFLLITSTGLLSQNIGIGTNTPTARLEVKGEGNNSLTNNLILKSQIGDTLFRLRNDGRIGIGYNGASYGRTVNIGGNGVNFYRVDAIFSGAIFPTDTSIVMWSEVGDDRYVILQPQWGRVGVGTYTPDAKLHVKGTVILGDGGTVITNLIKMTVSKNLAALAANSANTEIFPVPGAMPGSSVSISPANALADGLLIAYARVSVANTVEVTFMNVTAAAINPSTMEFYISVIR